MAFSSAVNGGGCGLLEDLKASSSILYKNQTDKNCLDPFKMRKIEAIQLLKCLHLRNRSETFSSLLGRVDKAFKQARQSGGGLIVVVPVL